MTGTISTITRPAGSVWQIDASHSNVEFAVKHLMIATVRGRFAGLAGTVTLDEVDPARTTVDVTIDAASIDTRVEQRDQHLKSPDFFAVATFPAIRFRSTAVEDRGGGEYLVKGNLTMHGVTKEVVLKASEEGRTRDPWGNDRIGFSAGGKVSRKDFGLTWNQALEAGGVVVGDEIRITIEVELVRQVEAAKAA